MFETAGQAHIFLATVYAGLFVGFLYDMLTVLRRTLKCGLSMTGALDLVFWVVAAAVLTAVLVFSGGDGLRAYMLLGFASGALLYGMGVHFILKAVGTFLKRAKNIVLGRTKKAQESPV